MIKMNSVNIFDRIGKKIDLKHLSQMICIDYKIGTYKMHKILRAGMDDFSYVMKTSTGKYVVKIFNHEKTLTDINRYNRQYRACMESLSEKQMPYILSTKDGVIKTVEIDDTVIIMCVIQYCFGKDFYTLGKRVTKEDIDQLVSIITVLHQSPSRLEIVYDNSTFPCLEKRFQYYKNELPEKMKEQGEEIIKQIKKIPLEKLPKVYMHGDVTKTNVMYHKKTGVVLIDFNTSGYGYRIVEIVKIMNAFIFDYHRPKQSIKLWEYFLKKYQQYLPLTELELQYIEVLQKADAYIGMILEYRIRYIQLDNDKENEYWYQNDRSILEVLT